MVCEKEGFSGVIAISVPFLFTTLVSDSHCEWSIGLPFRVIYLTRTR